MTREEIFELINANPAFHLATMDGDQPRTRGMLLYKADQDGIMFHSSTQKNLYQQILKNPKVELCFNDFKKGIQVRISGTLEIIEDRDVKDEICQHPTRQFIKKWRDSGELGDFYSTFAVFRLKSGIANTWTMATNLAPKEEIAL